MKSGSTDNITEGVLDAVNNARSKPIARLFYSNDNATTWSQLDDVKGLSFSANSKKSLELKIKA